MCSGRKYVINLLGLVNHADAAESPSPALRLYPPIPINVRFAKKTTYLPSGGGPDGTCPVLVRRGLNVGFVAYYMHRRKDLYGEDAMEFRPERWEGPGLRDIGWAYLPFHGGPRVCLGSKHFPRKKALKRRWH